MAAIERRASGVWRGALRGGSGAITVTSGALRETPFTYATRFVYFATGLAISLVASLAPHRTARI